MMGDSSAKNIQKLLCKICAGGIQHNSSHSGLASEATGIKGFVDFFSAGVACLLLSTEQRT